MKQEKNGTWVSWNENLKYNFKEMYHISNEEELQEIVSSRDKIRFFGSKQSSADIAAGTDVLINMTNYNKIVSYDYNQKTITVQSGLSLRELLEAIAVGYAYFGDE